jgi:hypothetical protein
VLGLSSQLQLPYSLFFLSAGDDPGPCISPASTLPLSCNAITRGHLPPTRIGAQLLRPLHCASTAPRTEPEPGPRVLASLVKTFCLCQLPQVTPSLRMPPWVSQLTPFSQNDGPVW